MGDELKRAASPYTKLEIAIKENGEKLDKICEYKEEQKKNDSKWREMWAQQKAKAEKQKRATTISSVGALLLTAAAFYLNVIKLDEESAFFRGLVAVLDVIVSVL